MFIFNSNTKIHIKFLVFFNWVFFLFLGLTKDFKQLRIFIETKKTSLSVAAGKGHLTFCKLLLCYGANADGAYTSEETPLYMAASRGHIDVCNLLIYFGASVNKADDRDKIPLFVAAKAGHADVCNLLEHHGADISCIAKEIESLLDIRCPKMAKLILRWKDKLGKNNSFC